MHTFLVVASVSMVSKSFMFVDLVIGQDGKTPIAKSANEFLARIGNFQLPNRCLEMLQGRRMKLSLRR